MFCGMSNGIRKYIAFFTVLSAMLIFTACGQNNNTESQDYTANDEHIANNEYTVDKEDKTADDAGGSTAQPQITEDTSEKDELFGENCIADQTFEVELSEYSGKVYFVPYAPFGDGEDFGIEIIQNGEVLTQIRGYVPEELADKKFSSLDAVSFYDVNYDGNTDIVLIETYGDTSFAAVYYGFSSYAYDYEKYFDLQVQLSEGISDQADVLTIPGIRSLLADGKKNGEFGGYKEAYRAVSRLCDLESGGREEYNLIYFDDDDIPELVAGVNGYYTSLFSYKDGKVYALMNRWAYGAMGNAGYEYCPKMNSMRNYNADYAGAIMYTTYMAIRDQNTMNVVAQIETFNFDDANGNGEPDENETGSIGYYGVSYIDGREATDEECASYDMGEYEPIVVNMSLEELKSKL